MRLIRFYSKIRSYWHLLLNLLFQIITISWLNALQKKKKKYLLILPKHVGAEVQFPIEHVISDGPSNLYPGRETYLSLAPAR